MKKSRNKLGTPVYDLQSMLRSISSGNVNILPVIPDGIYGPNTYASVQSFQSFYGLNPTGITDYITWNRIVSEYEKGLHNIPACQIKYKPVLSNPEISILQTKLKHLKAIYLSENAIEPNGRFDEETATMIKWLQRVSGLRETGNADILTQHALEGMFQNSIID